MSGAPFTAKDLRLQEIESTPEYRQLLTEIKGVSKIELHAHLGGAVSLEFCQKYSSADEYRELVDLIKNFKSGLDYKEGFKVFPKIAKILSTNQRIEEAAFDFCQQQYQDRVAVSELRTGLKRLDGTFEDYLQAVLRGLERGSKTYSVQVKLVLSLRRDTSSIDAKETVDLAIKYRSKGVCGLDISGDSTQGDGRGMFEELKKAKSQDLPITLHLGEHVLESPEQQMLELLTIQPDRVGHAVHLSGAARKWIEDRNIVVEACLRSAIGVQMIQKPIDHPALTMLREGHPVIFCSDDATLFGTLSEELALAGYLCSLSVQDIVHMQETTSMYAFS